MPFQYSFEEKLEMVLIYGECLRNASLAVETYRERFPERPHPSRKFFTDLTTHLRETGSFSHKKKTWDNPATTNELNSAMVVNLVENNPHMSTRQITGATNISQSSVCRILKKHTFYPHRMELHQELYGQDFENRMIFCRWAQGKIDQNPDFFKNLLMTDECTLKNNGQVNRHNMHYWAVVNPHWMRQRMNQNIWSLNVWGGVLGDRVIGPFFF